MSVGVIHFVNANYVNNKLDGHNMVRYSHYVSSNSLKRLDLARAARLAGFFFASRVAIAYPCQVLLQIVAVLTFCA
jgi:hypothetical protein